MTTPPVEIKSPVEEPAGEYTPPDVVAKALDMAQLQPTDVFLDLGSGDGRWVIAAAKRHVRKSVGIELKPARVALARRRIKAAGLTGLAYIQEGDFSFLDVSQATVVSMCLFPETTIELLPRLRSARVIISTHTPLPLAGVRKVMVRDYPVWVWVSP